MRPSRWAFGAKAVAHLSGACCRLRAASGPLTSHKVSVRPAKPGDAVKVRLHLADFTEIFYLKLVYDARLYELEL
jgi:hypothetical protein